MVSETKRGKPENTKKNLSEQREEPITNSTLSLGHTDGRGPTGGVCSFFALQLADAMIR